MNIILFRDGTGGIKVLEGNCYRSQAFTVAAILFILESVKVFLYQGDFHCRSNIKGIFPGQFFARNETSYHRNVNASKSL